MKRWTLALSVLLGCDSVPPVPTTCVRTAIEGRALRALVTYHDEGRLHEVMADAPLRAGEACVTLRPPADGAWPKNDWAISFGPFYIGPDDPTRRFTAWPIDFAIYDDVNGNGALDHGELRGRRSFTTYGGPVWFAEYERALETYLRADPFADDTLAIRPFVDADLSPRDPQEHTYGVQPVSPQVAVAGELGECDVDLYPRCIPSDTQEDDVTVDLIDPRLTPTQIQALDLPADTPVASSAPMDRLVQCVMFDAELLAVRYVRWTASPDREACVCRLQRHETWLYTLIAEPMSGVDCDGG